MNTAFAFHGSLFPAFFSVFGVIYLLGYFVVFRDWSPKHRPDAASCFISLFHGGPAAVLAASALLSRPTWGFAIPNSDFDGLVLDFSISYFSVDLLHYLSNTPGDYLFIAHHLATLFVFITCRYLTLHGAFALLVLLFLAEATSPFQNLWTLAGLRKADVPAADRLYNLISVPFYALYTAMRGVLGPIFFLNMTFFYLGGKAEGAIPTWVSTSWIFVVGGAIAVSILWISNLWAERYRGKRNANEVKKQS